MPTLDDRWSIVTAQRELACIFRGGKAKTPILNPSGGVYPRSAAESPGCARHKLRRGTPFRLATYLQKFTRIHYHNALGTRVARELSLPIVIASSICAARISAEVAVRPLRSNVCSSIVRASSNSAVNT